MTFEKSTKIRMIGHKKLGTLCWSLLNVGHFMAKCQMDSFDICLAI